MADNAYLEVSRFGGLVPFQIGKLLTASDAQRMQTLAAQNFYNWLSLLAYDGANEVPLTGFPEDSDHCKVTTTGDLTAQMAPGVGMYFDATKFTGSGGDAFQSQSYQPIVVDGTEVITLDTWDVNPRIDIVSLAPDTTDDQTQLVRVKNPTTGVETTDSVFMRRRYGFAVVVTKGTAAATPVQPSTPPGHVLIARAEVPGVSGAAVWRDCRPIFQLGDLFKGHPAADHTKDFIPQPIVKPNALRVSASSPTSLKLVVDEGRAVISGISRWYPRQTVTLAAADATHDRIDLVSAKRDGTIAVTTGTPGVTPAIPASPANSIDLAHARVAALDTTIAAGDLTDLRSTWLDSGGDWQPGVRRPISNQQFDDHVLNWQKLNAPSMELQVAAPTFPRHPTTAEFALTLTYPDGTTAYDGPFGELLTGFEVECRGLYEQVLSASYLATNTDFGAGDSTTYSTSTVGVPVNGNFAVYFKPTTGPIANVNQDGQPSFGEHHAFWMLGTTGTLIVDVIDGFLTPGDYKIMVTVRPTSRVGAAKRRVVTLSVP